MAYDKKRLALDAEKFDGMELKAFILGIIDALDNRVTRGCAEAVEPYLIYRSQGMREAVRIVRELINEPLNSFKEQSTGDTRKGSGD